MKKKIFTREVKVGLMVISAIFVLYFGFNFLKGIDIFSSVNNYYATYENIGGLVKSSPVYIKGYKVGQVEEIHYDFMHHPSFIIRLSVSRDIRLPKGTQVQLYDDGLMGGKAIQLILPENSTPDQFCNSRDTLQSSVGIGLVDKITSGLMPDIQSISKQTDSLIRSVRMLIQNKSIDKSLASIEKTTSDLSVSSSRLKALMNNDLPHIVGNVNTITNDFKQISGNLKKIDYAQTIADVNHTIANLNLITDKINNSEGTLGLLLNNKDLYINLSNTAASSNKLLIDLKENPKRYVHFSLFGGKKE